MFEKIKLKNNSVSCTLDFSQAIGLLSGVSRDPMKSAESLSLNPFAIIKINDGEGLRFNNKVVQPQITAVDAKATRSLKKKLSPVGV